MRKYLRIISLILAIALMCATLFSCDFISRVISSDNNSKNENDNENDYYDVDTVYAKALSLGYAGTLEEFIELVSGRDGKDGVDGKDGLDGAGISSSIIDNQGHLIFVLTDGTTIDAGKLPGYESKDHGVFEVTFDYGEGVTETVYSQNYKVEPPKTPERNGYVFDYWYVSTRISDDSYQDLIWCFDAFAVTSDITLYAAWRLDTSSGNGNQNNTGFSDFVMPEGGYDGSEVTITFYHTMGSRLRDVLDNAIERFNELYPNITIEHSSIGGYNDVRDQIMHDIVYGTQPNLAYCYPDHVALYNIASTVQTLDVFIEDETVGFTEEQIDDFIGGFYDEGRAYGDDKMYTLPFSKSTEVLYYNKTFFDAHNIPVPTTWEEMEEVCKAIKAIEPTCIPLGYDSESNWFITMCEQYKSPYTSATGENFLFNNQQNIDFVTKFRTWYQNKWVTTEALSGGYTSALFTGNSSSSAEGSEASKDTRCYMCIGSTGGAPYQQPSQTNGEFDFEVGIAPIPQVNKEDPAAISQGPSLCIFKQNDTQEVLATWLFVKFLTTDVETQAEFSMNTGYIPVIGSAQQNEAYAEFLAEASTENISAYAIKIALEQADAYFVSPAFNGSSVARDQVGLLLQKCFVLPDAGLEAAIKKAFEDAVKECENYQ